MMGLRWCTLAAVLSVGGCLGLVPNPAGAQGVPPALVKHPELVVVNAKVVTADEGFSIRQAVAIRDGKVLAVGTTAEIRALAGPNSRVVDAGGRTVLPGLNDSHVHLFRAGFRWKWEVRADEARSVQDILNAVKARAQQVPPGTWILSLGGWHHTQLRERRMPSRAELDAVAPAHPVHVQSGYDVAQMNTAAIKASGITGATPAPPGAVLERDAQGNFSGVIRGFMGMRFAETKFPAPTLEDKIEGLRLAMRDFNAAGLTSVIEGVGGGVADDDYQALFELWRRRQMTLRMGMHFSGYDPEHALSWIRHLPGGFGDDMLRLNGVGEILMWPAWDGAIPAQFSMSQDTKAQMQRVLEAAARNRLTVQLHATLDTSMNALLDIMEEVHRRYPIDALRWALLHADQITPQMMERMKRLGMGALLQVRHTANSEGFHHAWGDRAHDAPPFQTVLHSGLPTAAGTDGPIFVSYRPFIAIWSLVTGKDWRGDVVHRTERLTREEALRMYTRNGAWFTFEEQRKGVLAPGMLGDLIVLDRDYLTVPEDEIRLLRPVMTVVGGTVVYEAQP